jgi:FkbM family methyltransferase
MNSSAYQPASRDQASGDPASGESAPANAERSTLLERVGENISDAVRFGPTFALRHVSNLVGRPLHTTTIDGFPVHLRRGSTDAAVFRQIFRKGDWDFNRFPQAQRVWKAYHAIVRAGEVPIIIDAGANVGAASLWFARQFSQASVVAVEPDPGNAQMCRLNTNAVSNVTVEEAAVGSSSGAANLHNPQGTAVAVQTLRSSSGTVALRTVPDLGQGGRLFIVKIDIEGFESDLFSANTDWLDQVSMIMIETHDWLLPGQFSSRSLQRAMAERPFEMLLSGENLFYVR